MCTWKLFGGEIVRMQIDFHFQTAPKAEFQQIRERKRWRTKTLFVVVSFVEVRLSDSKRTILDLYKV